MSFYGNITLRKPRNNKSDTELLTDDDDDSKDEQGLDSTSNSMPILSDYEDDDQIKELKQQIEQLKTDLKAAHLEIDNLNLENSNLKIRLEDSLKKNSLCKKITDSLKNDYVTPKNKQKSKSTPQKIHIQSHKSSKSADTTRTETIKTCDINTESAAIHNVTPNTITEVTNPKICLITSNRRNKILEISQDALRKQGRVCHFLAPGVGVMELLRGIDKKLENYSKKDYCIIMIGEADFQSTNNYFDLVQNIRSALETQQHTNIILCLPVYMCSDFTTMFNGRVETFNNLLHLDNHTHKYATVLDSNQKLTYYDNKAFTKKHGTITNYGIRTIFTQINRLLHDTRTSNNMNYVENTESQESSPDSQEIRTGPQDTVHSGEQRQFFLH